MIRKEDQQNLISYLEGMRGEDTSIENAAISMVVALIQLGLLDYVCSGGSAEEFSGIAIYQVSEYIDKLMKERLNELMDEAIYNALTEED
jgi:hypothetical protein